MPATTLIDVSTDFQSDAGRRDPDLYSPLLQIYHQLLWSKALPSGAVFALEAERVGSVRVLRHRSEKGDFVLSSDTLANSSRGPRHAFYEQMGPQANARWHREGGTIGGRLIFPRNRVDGRQTINQARGTHPRVRDRFDLTLEAIRRHYSGEESPLKETFGRYADFFALFQDFNGYVDFFLLQDLVDDGQTVKFYLPFSGFVKDPLPATFEDYARFRENQLSFVAARNERIIHAMTGRLDRPTP